MRSLRIHARGPAEQRNLDMTEWIMHSIKKPCQ